jgi:NADH:ubiquinone oxidoreductase subunit 6 (subunit J)
MAYGKSLHSVGSVLATVVYSAFSFSMFYIFLATGEIFPILISGFFALWGVVGLLMHLRAGLDYWKFGEIRLVVDKPYPFIGGRLSAAIMLPSRLKGLRTLEVELISKGVGGTHKAEEPLWAARQKVPVRSVRLKPVARVEFEIPEDLEPSGENSSKWELRIQADVPGLDLDRTIAVEMHMTPPGYVKAAKPVAADARMPGPPPAMATTRAEARPANAGEERPPLTSPASAAAHAEDPPDQRSLFVLVALNLIPLAGVAFFGWRVGDCILLYWVENVVIGGFNILRIMTAVIDTSKYDQRGVRISGAHLVLAKLFLAAFFLAHYGGFCAVHGEFLIYMFPPEGAAEANRELLATVRGLLAGPAFAAAVLAMVVSHGYSFLRNYLGRGENVHVDVGEMMMRPYKRIFVTTLFILLGGLVLMGLKSPLVGMLFFVSIKIALDAYMHRREHAR